MNIVKEKKKGLKRALQRVGLLFKHKEEEPTGLKGQIFIKGYESGEQVLSWESPNVIVNTASILVARLLKDPSEPTFGIRYLGVGQGSPSWDKQDPPAPTTNQTSLESEIFRKAVDQTTFINPVTGENSETPTNVVDYAFNFLEGEATGALVELGLYGGDATDGLNTGTLVNYRTFPVLNKTNAMAFTIIIRITS